jgi:hypothetical protein
MPLRDHFHPPLTDRYSWDVFHGQWPAMIVLALGRVLPPNYYAGPTVRLGAGIELDVGTYETPEAVEPVPVGESGTALTALPESTLTVVSEVPTADEYEVRVYNVAKARELVAAIEIVSPSNKDRPEHRREFVAKCASLIRQGVCVSVIDLVTERRANLYLDLLDFLGESDPEFERHGAPLYAVTCAGRVQAGKWALKTWAYPLTIGQPLPTLPIRLSEWRGVSLDLETPYEETCRALRMPK